MFIRCAYFAGRPVPGQEKLLRERLTALLKMYVRFENIVSLQLLVAGEAEEGSPGLYATLQLCFKSEADLKAALATPFRQECRAFFLANVLPLFEGTVKHINNDVEEALA